jgi:catechol 2,3-dioxygenase-like lactoylglutathione lyase family enzyme
LISHIHSVTILVNDQQAAVDFYTSVLGWETVIDQQMAPEMRFVTVRPPGAETQLSHGHESWAGDIGTVGGNTGISLITRDIDAAHKTLSERGVRFDGEIETMPWGDRAIWFSDPDGNRFFLNEEKAPAQ